MYQRGGGGNLTNSVISNLQTCILCKFTLRTMLNSS